MEEFNEGKVIPDIDGSPITIDRFIAEGSQGQVYKVKYKGSEKALKWYFPGALKDSEAFYENLKSNADKGSPDPAFLWPITVTKKVEGSFGYVMDLLPEGYWELTDIFLAKGTDPGYFKTFKAVTEACIRITSAFRQIHKLGYSYQDMNSGNFFINTNTGAVLIGDNDNVAPNGTYTGIIGTPGYMAPEVVVGESKPNVHTDEFSLAVVLFSLLLQGHPLEGKRWTYACLTPAVERALYGSDPLFIFDPDNDDNRPVKGVHNNVLSRWKFLPQYMKDLFLKAFSKQAMKDPNRRVKELDWMKALTRFQSDIVRCPSCGGEIYITDATSTPCDMCKKMFKVEHTLKLYEYSVTAAKNTRVYKCQIQVCNADDALVPVVRVIARTDDPSILGVRNMTGNTLSATTPSGKPKQVKPDEVVPLKSGIKIDAFDGTIEIQ